MSNTTLPPALRAKLEKRGIIPKSTITKHNEPAAVASPQPTQNGRSSGSHAPAEPKISATAPVHPPAQKKPAPLPPHWQELRDENTYVGDVVINNLSRTYSIVI